MSLPWENSLAVLELLSLVCSSALPRGNLSTCLSDTPILGSGHVLLYPLDILLLPRHEGNIYRKTWQERLSYQKHQQKKTTYWRNLGHNRYQHLDRRLSTLQPGTLIGPNNTLDNNFPLRSLWGPEPSNHIPLSRKAKNTPSKRPVEVRITDEAL